MARLDQTNVRSLAGDFVSRPMYAALGEIGKDWGWVLAGGIGFIVLGCLAYLWPVLSTVSLEFALGTVFFIGGIIDAIHCLRFRTEAGLGWRVLQSVAGLVTGILMLRYPLAGILGVGIAMAFYFFVSATIKGAVAFGMRPISGWGWALLSAISSFALGAFTILTFPVSSLWVPGAILGIDFVIYGVSLSGLAFELRSIRRNILDRGVRSAA